MDMWRKVLVYNSQRWTAAELAAKHVVDVVVVSDGIGAAKVTTAAIALGYAPVALLRFIYIECNHSSNCIRVRTHVVPFLSRVPFFLSHVHTSPPSLSLSLVLVLSLHLSALTTHRETQYK